MDRPLRVAVAQAATVADRHANLAECRRLVARAAAASADLVVLPEAALTRVADDVTPAGEPLTGPFVTGLAETGARLGITLVVGTLVPADGGRVRNTAVVLREGGVVASYDKLHLYDAFGRRESDHVESGGGPVVTLDVLGLRVGVLICYDLRFPEMARALATAGAQLLVVPSAWVAGEHKLDHWRTLCRARAMENGCYLAAAGSTGPQRTGHSMVVDPSGVVLTELGDAVGVTDAEISVDRLDDVRRTSPYLEQRRFAFATRPGPAPMDAPTDAPTDALTEELR